MTRHTFLLKPRWSDLDAYGHVNNVTWLEYLQEARVDMLFVHAPDHGSHRLADAILVVRAEIDYRRPLVLRQAPYAIQLWVSKLGAASFTVSYEVTDDPAGAVGAAGGDGAADGDGAATVYGRARTVLAPVDLPAGTPRRLTPAERAVLGRFVE